MTPEQREARIRKLERHVDLMLRAVKMNLDEILQLKGEADNPAQRRQRLHLVK